MKACVIQLKAQWTSYYHLFSLWIIIKCEADILRQCHYSKLSVHLTFKQEKSAQANKEICVYGK